MRRGASPLLLASSELLKNAIGDPTGLIVKARKKAAAKVSAEAPLPPLDKWTSIASEGPLLLEPEIAPGPFLSFSKVRSFLVFMVVGAAVVGELYYLLSIDISHLIEEEKIAMEDVRGRRRLALLERDKLFPEFTASNAYEELQRLMQQQEHEIAEQEEEIRSSTSMLHSEVTYRFRIWWNRSLMHLQDAVDLFFTSLEERKSSALRNKIEATLHQNLYQLVELRQIDDSEIRKSDA